MADLRVRARKTKAIKRLKACFRPFKPAYCFVRNNFEQLRMLSGWASAPLLHRTELAAGMHVPPKGFYGTTSEWFAKRRRSVDDTHSAYHEIFPARRVPPYLVRTVGMAVNWDREGGRYPLVPAAFAARIGGGRVFGRFGDVVAPDGRVLADISFVYARRLFAEKHEHSFFSSSLLPPVADVRGTICLLASTYADTNYFHWMFNVLPRLELFRLAGTDLDSVDAFIVNRMNWDFCRETLIRVGIPLHKVIESDEEMHLRAGNLLVAPSLRAGYHMERWVLDFLRREFLEAAGPSASGGKRLYISRDDAGYRRIRNEPECLDVLVQCGFEKISLSGMTVAEQAELFSSAEAVVAPHGAGLANLVFCNPGTRVVELFSPVWLKPCYWELCNGACLEYWYLVGGGDGEQGISGLKQDYTIDVRELAETIKAAGLHRWSNEWT
jgi:hypothetical protein